jgi:hypothetical protein
MGPMPGPMDSMMNMALLPVGVRAGWALVLVAVALVHLWHARSMSGQPRWWHIVHVLMSVGMLTMYADIHQRDLNLVIAVLFAATAVVLSVTLTRSPGYYPTNPATSPASRSPSTPGCC